MKQCILRIRDEVNVRFEGLSPTDRRRLSRTVRCFDPDSYYKPAYKLGRWDGYITFCDIGGRTFVNLLERLLPVVIDQGYDIKIEDERVGKNRKFEFEEVDVNSYSHITWPKGHQLEGQPIILRDHQVEAINLYLKTTQSIQIISTGSGKTIISAILSHKTEPYGRSIVIVPTKDLVTQTEEDFINFGLDVGVYYGNRKEVNKTHTICTWQSLESLNKKSDSSNNLIKDFIKGVICVIIDESHGVSASVLKNLLTQIFNHVPIRWGMTGTLPTQEIDQTSLNVAVGPVINTIRAKHLQDKGILSKLHINVIRTREHHTKFPNYQSELKHLVSDKERITNLVDKVIKPITEDGNTLILIDRISSGELLNKLIPGSVFVSGDTKSKDRKKEYDDVKVMDDKVIIATLGVASTGINIVRIYNLILIEPGKSFIRVIQSIGRGIRKAEDKDFLNVYDICSNAKYSLRHQKTRQKYYKEQEYPFSSKIIDIY